MTRSNCILYLNQMMSSESKIERVKAEWKEMRIRNETICGS